MHIRDLATRLSGILTTPPTAGSTGLFPFGSVFCATRHKLHGVSAPRPCAVVVLDGRKMLGHGEEFMQADAGSMFLLPPQVDFQVENIPGPSTGRYMALCIDFDQDMVARVASETSEIEPEAPLAANSPSVWATSSRKAAKTSATVRPVAHAKRAATEGAAKERTAKDTTDSATKHLPGAAGIDRLRVHCDQPLLLALSHLLDMAAAGAAAPILSHCREEVLLLLAARCEGFDLLWRSSGTWSSRCAALVGLEPGRAWTAAEVASQLGTGERTLRRNLAAEGTGFRRVLQDVRLNAGLTLLQTGWSNVGETALRCGYGSASRFAMLFRKRFGVSPSEVLGYNDEGMHTHGAGMSTAREGRAASME